MQRFEANATSIPLSRTLPVQPMPPMPHMPPLPPQAALTSPLPQASTLLMHTIVCIAYSAHAGHATCDAPVAIAPIAHAVLVNSATAHVDGGFLLCISNCGTRVARVCAATPPAAPASEPIEGRVARLSRVAARLVHEVAGAAAEADNGR